MDIESSQEFRSDEVKALYTRYLHRDADPSGLANFTNFLAGGGTVEQVEAIIAGSPEYFQVRGGSSNNGFLQALYQDGLSRGIDPSGQMIFGNALMNGATRAQVATAIFTSTEFRQDLVQSDYQNFLHRAADPSGLGTFVNALAHGTSDEQVAADIIGSAEFFAGV